MITGDRWNEDVRLDLNPWNHPWVGEVAVAILLAYGGWGLGTGIATVLHSLS